MDTDALRSSSSHFSSGSQYTCKGHPAPSPGTENKFLAQHRTHPYASCKILTFFLATADCGKCPV